MPKASSDFEPKRAQTVFDVICRLADDGIAKGEDLDMYAAVLCFGLRHASTCDLLALLEERTKAIELQDNADATSTTQLTHSQALSLLASQGINGTTAQEYLKKIYTSSGQVLYKIFGRKPLVNLLASGGARYCEKYVEEHLTPESAGKYFIEIRSSSQL